MARNGSVQHAINIPQAQHAPHFLHLSKLLYVLGWGVGGGERIGVDLVIGCSRDP